MAFCHHLVYRFQDYSYLYTVKELFIIIIFFFQYSSILRVLIKKSPGQTRATNLIIYLRIYNVVENSLAGFTSNRNDDNPNLPILS